MYNASWPSWHSVDSTNYAFLPKVRSQGKGRSSVANGLLLNKKEPLYFLSFSLPLFTSITLAMSHWLIATFWKSDWSDKCGVQSVVSYSQLFSTKNILMSLLPLSLLQSVFDMFYFAAAKFVVHICLFLFFFYHIRQWHQDTSNLSPVSETRKKKPITLFLCYFCYFIISLLVLQVSSL